MPARARRGGGRLERGLRPRDDDGLGPGEARVAGLGRLVARRAQMLRDGGRRLDADTGARIARASAKVVGSGTVGPEPITAGSSPGTSEIRRLTTRAGCAAAARRPPLIAERCLRTAFICVDVGARGEQRAVDRLLVLEREPGGRQREQRRGAARDQAQHQVALARLPGIVEHAARGGAARGVRHRMRRLDHLDPGARHGVAVAGDHEAFERARPVPLDRARHRRRGLAGAEHDGAAGGRRAADAARGSRPAAPLRSRRPAARAGRIEARPTFRTSGDGRPSTAPEPRSARHRWPAQSSSARAPGSVPVKAADCRPSHDPAPRVMATGSRASVTRGNCEWDRAIVFRSRTDRVSRAARRRPDGAADATAAP